ncbi:astacin [Teladorsagia circumcincta]|uniref:Metalloendopeptidase n=1 Tax=Teladorsagia circumcincta TaxID=45464 RepID=A0A2G9UDE2_TELCI|nr:astacin [Teladorsagia circumcincta]
MSYDILECGTTPMIWCRGLMKMIRILLLLAVLFDSSFCLSEKGRLALTKAHKGIDLEKRHERLRKLGLKSLGLNSTGGNGTSTANAAGPDISSAFGGVASIEEVNRIEGIDEYLFDGDMILTEYGAAQCARKRHCKPLPCKAPNSSVCYSLDEQQTAPNRQYTRTVLKYLQQRTCLSFIESTTAARRIKVFPGAGCYSYVGMLSGVQELSLASGCMVVGTVAHEFTHALGSVHTHMRHDRDNFVTVNLTNVIEGYANNFVKQSLTINPVPYEYGSDMHYTSNSSNLLLRTVEYDFGKQPQSSSNRRI